MLAPTLGIVSQRFQNDCAVAALATVCEVGYEEALGAFRCNVCMDGASLDQILAAAKRLKRPLRIARLPFYSMGEDTGILDLGQPRVSYNHMVVLHGGYVIDTYPDRPTLWELDLYLETTKASVLNFLVRRERK